MAANVVDDVPLNASDYIIAAAMKKRSTFIVHTNLPDLYADQTKDESEVREIEFSTEVFENHSVWLIVLIVLIVVVSLWRFHVGFLYQKYPSGAREHNKLYPWVSSRNLI